MLPKINFFRLLSDADPGEAFTLSQYDDQKNYFCGLIQFIKDGDGRNFKLF